MRGFLQRLIAGGATVTAVEIEKIIDLDRTADLTLVNQWLEQSTDWGQNNLEGDGECRTS